MSELTRSDTATGGDERSVSDQQIVGPRKHSRIPSLVAALVPPVIYLIYVGHYALNVPVVDDWLRIPLINSARHGHFVIGGAWAQYNETRIFVGNVIIVAVGVLDHFNLRTLIFFNAGLFILTFWIFLLLFRAYVRHRPGPLSILAIGVLWFSLADVQNALWGFQVHWFLVPFFLVVMIYLLLIPKSHRDLAFTLAVLAAVGASCSIVQGFVLWPVGLICLLWSRPRVRRVYYECALWIGSAALTAWLYSLGFNFHTPACGLKGCTATPALTHPIATARFIFILAGNVFPSIRLGHQELIGALIVLAAGFVVVQSFRERHTQQRLPLPILLITFSLLFDFMIAAGRGAFGPLVALSNRYVMPNQILLLSILVYAFGHIPHRQTTTDSKTRAYFVRWVGLGIVGIVLVIQVSVATPFGIRDGSWSDHIAKTDARVLANFDRVPTAKRGCAMSEFMFVGLSPPPAALAIGLPILHEAKRDELSIFQPAQLRSWRAEGLPARTCGLPGTG